MRRRASLIGVTTVVALGGPAASSWGEAAAKLHLSLESDPASAASQLVEAARRLRAIVIARTAAPGSWDREVAEQIAALEPAPAVVLVAGPGDSTDGLASLAFDTTTPLDDADKTRFFAALADAAKKTLAHDDLETLEAWWSASRDVVIAGSIADAPVDARVAMAMSAFALAGRAWPVAHARALGVDVAGALHAGVLSQDGAWLSIEPAWHERAQAAVASASAELGARVADALVAVFGADAFALIRAAELSVAAGAHEAADARYGRALTVAEDTRVRREVVARWARALEGLPTETQAPLCVAAAERALEAGEADEAFRWAKLASAHAPEDAKTTLLMGRAAVAMGDLVTAKAALERKSASSADGETQARLAVELAEVAYLTGDHERAKNESERAMTTSTHAPTRLRARNTLGKLLLASASWKRAEAHFAEDALHAVSAGDRTAELRARVNRGIALLSQGSADEARAIFDGVLSEGEARGDLRACAFALDNLAVVAMWRHEYGSALELLERTLKIRQRLGDRLATARILANLGELRRKLGLLDHAEHAVAFGRRLLAPGMPTEMSAHFSVVAARVALARGNTALAQREVAKAIADGSAVGNSEYLGEDLRVAARAALEDGDLARVEQLAERAKALAGTEEGRAEVAVIVASLARAAGKSFVDQASHAVTLARAAGEEELLREAHVLSFEAHRALGDHASARVQLDSAITVRDAVAASLSGDVRASFLARPEIVALGRLVSLTTDVTLRPDDDEGPRTQRSPRAPRAREIVGDDPAVRGLMLAIRRVARADSTVLIHGESGTGKELVAEAIHRSSDRASGPLVTVNCAALVETLLLSELFGHEKGAFTGAVARRRGRFELAENGTLFLDEIGDISPRTQVALLRVLQERTFERVGGTTSIRANVRIICATHRDLKSMVERGEFREDLYYRLRGITLEVPSLRSRAGDIPRIADNLLERIADERGESKKTLSTEALELLARHRWPGNVRELDNVLRAVSLFSEGEVIAAADLTTNVEELRGLGVASPSRIPPAPATLSSSDAPSADDAFDGDESGPLPLGEAGPTAVAYACVRQGSVSLSDLKRQIERDCIARALAETRGNITKAAALLGMKRPRLSQLVKQYGLAAVSTESQ